jgi:hypothetical protein
MAASILTLKSLRQLDEEFIDQTLRRRIIRPLGRTRIGQYAFLGQAQNFITYNTGDSGEILFGQASHSEIAEEAGLIPRAEVYDYGKLFPIRMCGSRQS